MGTYTAIILHKPNFRGFAHRAIQALADSLDGPNECVQLEAEGLDNVFAQLNHGSRCELPGYHGRNLSVGDVVIAPDKHVYMCANSGWMEVR